MKARKQAEAAARWTSAQTVPKSSPFRAPSRIIVCTEAIELFRRLSTADELAAFLTIPAYRMIV